MELKIIIFFYQAKNSYDRHHCRTVASKEHRDAYFAGTYEHISICVYVCMYICARMVLSNQSSS